MKLLLDWVSGLGCLVGIAVCIGFWIYSIQHIILMVPLTKPELVLSVAIKRFG